MASTDARPIPRKNVAYRVTFPLLDSDGDLVTAAAALDSEVSLDGGVFADATNEATEIATSSGMYFLDLTAAEMNADTVAIVVKTTTVGAKTTPIVLYPEEAGDVRVDVVQISGDSVAADNAEAWFDNTGFAASASTVGTVNSVATGGITAGSIATDAIGAAELAADAVTEIADGILNRDMSTGTDSGTEAIRTVRQALRALRNRFSISGTTRTVYKENDVTASWTSTLQTDAAANPIVGDDPTGP